MQACEQDVGNSNPAGGNIGTPIGDNSCSTDSRLMSIVSSINSVDPWDGGLLYDNWWIAGGKTAPRGNHPVWASRTANPNNAQQGSATWRCKECHGWDYQGVNGAYGDTNGTHYTGFPGIYNARLKTNTEVFCAIYSGEGINAQHRFANTLSDTEILQLTRFITANDNTGVINTTNTFVTRAGQPLGNVNAGSTVYGSTVADCVRCHGVNGELRVGGSTLGQLSTENPWEVIHKIRYGHPGSNPIMPAYVTSYRDVGNRIRNPLTNQQISDVLAYAASLDPGTGNQGACAVNNQNFVNNNYNQASEINGGKLYDNWAVTRNTTTPTSNHPLWITRSSTINTRTGAETWRCKECHGWDYKGVDGAYGDRTNSHYTGFQGILGTRNRSAVDLFCAIRDGEGVKTNGATLDSRHAFNTTNLSDFDILDIVRFIREPDVIDGNGMVNMSSFISDTSRLALGDRNLGRSVYETKANCDACHGLEGNLSMGTTTLGALSSSNPWEVLHKIRYGHPGSSPVMPAFIEDGLRGTYNELTDADMKNVLAHSQTLTGNVGTQPIDRNTCLTDKAGLVSRDYNRETATQGGALYDKWWTALGYNNGPTTDHPLWAQQRTNNRFGADTWRCKECHGWDYKGRDGAYGDRTNSHYTGFPGIRSALGKQPIDVFCSIYAGTPNDADHQFNPSNSNLTDQAVLQLTKFVLEGDNKGQIDMDQYIDPTGSVTGDPNRGRTEYGNNCTRCHGTDGTLYLNNITLGALGNDNPWEVLHKIRYGHPGSNPTMPAFVDEGLSRNVMRDILVHVRTLTQTGGTPIGDVQDDVILGGLLYDNWILQTEASTPRNDNPLWALQNSNTRTGADTWRCKECHGWDYEGNAGQYDLTSDHYTGFKGLLDVALSTRSEDSIFNYIKNGKDYSGTVMHNFGTVLSDASIRALARFIKGGINGMIDTKLYIDENTGAPINGNATTGQTLFTFDGQFAGKANCSLCHGLDGRQINFGTNNNPEYLADVGINNPWEVLHKARFGQPGSIMPSTIVNGLSTRNVVDIITHIQTLDPTPPPRNNNDD